MRAWFVFVSFVFGLSLLPVAAQDLPSPVIAAPATATLWRFEARYKVELIEVKARDETGVDWPGSDEILVIADLDSIRDLGSYELWIDKGLGDMDSGETVKIGPENACLLLATDEVVDGKWSCAETGHPLPFTLTFTVLERDGVGRVFWESLISGGGVGFRKYVPTHGDISLNCLIGSRDEFNSVGSVRKVYSAEDLAGLAVGQSRQGKLVVNYCSSTVTIDGAICGSSGWWDSWNGVYRLSVRVTRLKNVLVGFDPPEDPLVPSQMVIEAPGSPTR